MGISDSVRNSGWLKRSSCRHESHKKITKYKANCQRGALTMAAVLSLDANTASSLLVAILTQFCVSPGTTLGGVWRGRRCWRQS